MNLPNRIKDKNVDSFYLDMKYETNPEIRALMLYDKFGDVRTLSSEEKKEFYKNMEKVGVTPNEEFIKEYIEIIESYSKNKPSN